MRVLALLLLARIAFADASVGGTVGERVLIPPGSHRGQLSLRYGYHEGGVGAVINSQYDVELELVTKAGAVELRVHGRGERTTTYTTPGTPRPADKSAWPIDAVLVGELQGGTLRLHDKDGSAAQEMRCTAPTVDVGAGPMRILRCEPTTLRKGFPWNDRVPPFLRVPLVVALTGKVRAEISTMVPVSSEESPPLAQISLLPAR